MSGLQKGDRAAFSRESCDAEPLVRDRFLDSCSGIAGFGSLVALVVLDTLRVFGAGFLATLRAMMVLLADFGTYAY